MPILVVEERFDPPVDVSKVNPNSEKLSICLPTYDVTWVASFLGSDGSRCVCVYDAPSADASARRIGPPVYPSWRCGRRTTTSLSHDDHPQSSGRPVVFHRQWGG
jgi:hypothetical protein